VIDHRDQVMVSGSLPVPTSFLAINTNHSHLSSPLHILVYSSFLLSDCANFLQVHSPALNSVLLSNVTGPWTYFWPWSLTGSLRFLTCLPCLHLFSASWILPLDHTFWIVCLDISGTFGPDLGPALDWILACSLNLLMNEVFFFFSEWNWTFVLSKSFCVWIKALQLPSTGTPSPAINLHQ